MAFTLSLTAYDLSDEGPGRTVNEDATLVREDLGLFAIADGAGGRGRGDVAATLALRSVENYVGSTVRRCHDRPDYDQLGISEQAKRLSAAVHQAHANIIDVVRQDPARQGMATTIVAALFASRTNRIHIAHVGDSRCYRVRDGRLELLTVDDTISTDILEMRPQTGDDVLDRLPRNSVVRALGMKEELRVRISSHNLIAGDQFLLCSDGLTAYVSEEIIAESMREHDPPSVVASELLNHALAARSQDNISLLVIECNEIVIDDAVDTRRYYEAPTHPPSAPTMMVDEAPNSAELQGPEILAHGLTINAVDSIEAMEEWARESDYPTVPFVPADTTYAEPQFNPELLEAPPTTQSSNELVHEFDEEADSLPPLSVSPDDLELDEEEDSDLQVPSVPPRE